MRFLHGDVHTVKHKEDDHLPTNPISNQEVRDLLDARSSYDYPKARILPATDREHDIRLGPDLYGKFSLPRTDEVTDTALDAYHYRLLRSGQQEDRLLGLASVVYWGYYSFGHAYAENRVKWLVNGYRTQLATTPRMAYACTTAAQNHLHRKDLGKALASLRNLSQLNQTPFASKVIAFMAPSIAGVYDNRISRGLAQEPWAGGMNANVGRVDSSKVSASYQSWCIYLSQIASQLNLGISLGKEWAWSCGNEEGQRWRAIDVERALFAFYGRSKIGAVQNNS